MLGLDFLKIVALSALCITNNAINPVTSQPRAIATAVFDDYRGSRGDNDAYIIPDGEQAVVFSPNGKYTITVCGKTARLSNAAGDAPVQSMTHDTPIKFVAFSRDCSYVVIAGGKTAAIWDLSGGHLCATIKHASEIKSLYYGPNTNRLATSTANRWWLWSVPNGAPVFNTPLASYSPYLD
jgi:WD40 repeat protein